jgi:hypothetical protein
MRNPLARLVVMSLCALGSAGPHAAEPLQASDFAGVFPLANVNEGLNALEMTEPVYRAATMRSLHDLRVFNGQGDALPLALLPQPPAPSPEMRVVPLTLAALPARTDARDAALQSYALRFERDRTRAIIEIKGGEAPPVAPAPETSDIGGYLIDARPLKDMKGRLQLMFAPSAPDYAGRAEVLGSEDLVTWRVLVSGPLAKERRLGDVIEKGQFELDRPPSFLRVAWAGAAAPQIGVAFFERPEQAASTLPRALLASTLGNDGRSLYVDVPRALPIERLYIRMPQVNQSLRVSVYRHVDDPAPRSRHLGLVPRRTPERWVTVGVLDVFRVTRDGTEVEGPPLAFSAVTDRLRIDAAQPFAGALPTVEAEWRPARIAFAARAPGPYRLAAGRDGAAPPPPLDLNALLPKDDPAGMQLPRAGVDVVAAGGTAMADAAAARAERIAAEAHWSRVLLWAVLLGAVVGLAWMAWRLAGQLRAPPSHRPEG